MLRIFNKRENPKPKSTHCFNTSTLKDTGFIFSDESPDDEPSNTAINNNYKEDATTTLPETETETESQLPPFNKLVVHKRKRHPDPLTLKNVASLYPAKPNIENNASESSSDSEVPDVQYRGHTDADDKPPQKFPPSDAEEIVQSWPSKIVPEGRKRVVVYMTSLSLSSSVFEACKTVRLIFKGLGVKVEEFDMLMDSTFIDELQRIMKVNELSLPRIFIGGRYIGGAYEVMKLNGTGQLKKLVEGLPEREPGVCEDCGGYKFFLINSTKFRTCTACKENVLNSVLGSSETRLHICFEAQVKQNQYVYLIYSVEGSLLGSQRSNPPTFNRDAVIFGYQSMGCGVYDSKIVLAGGKRESFRSSQDSLITYDMNNDIVSYKAFPPLEWCLGVKALPFQLHKKLCVLDHNARVVHFCCPALETDWGITILSGGQDEEPNDKRKYSSLVVGNSCCISVPYSDITYIHQSSYDTWPKKWIKHSDASLPFSGHATFYHQDGFDNFVIIYLEHGVVRVFPFDFSGFGDSQVLFTIDSHTVGGKFEYGYFADFGRGCFCLTASDKSYIYLYTFKITRYGKKSGPLKVQARILSRYSFAFDCFCTEGNKIEHVVGCFAPAPNKEAILYADRTRFKTRFKNCGWINDDHHQYGWESTANSFYENDTAATESSTYPDEANSSTYSDGTGFSESDEGDVDPVDQFALDYMQAHDRL